MVASSGAEGWRAVGVRLSLKRLPRPGRPGDVGEIGEDQISCRPDDLRMSCVPRPRARSTRSGCRTANQFPHDGPKRNIIIHSIVTVQVFPYANIVYIAG